jgi:putative transposase
MGLGELLQAHRSGEDELFRPADVPHARGFEKRLLRLERQPLSRRRREGIVLTAKVCRIHERSRQTYGSPRVHAELRPIGTRCSRKRVARLMREAGLQGCMRGGRKRTTRRSKGAPPAEELVKRNFAATEMDRAWVADITYVHTWDGFL